jgi:hypothetical protein
MSEPRDLSLTVDVPPVPVGNEPQDPGHPVDHFSAPVDPLVAGFASDT